ncbi:MAG: DNA mismatch endonuclease Vsr [Planctomycetia bacterium]|nr:DNA mismatch endonuclease Vsr [Planctomycetia bacterium]
MADVFSKAERSRIMAAVKSRDTTPEMIVRRLVHSLGGRYRLHAAQLPGCPDLVLPARRKIIFVHGCFWHRHCCAAGRSMPASRADYWATKFARNVARDRRSRRALRRLRWNVLVVWECQTRVGRMGALKARLERFLAEDLEGEAT